ncbi:MAG: UDP-N-acetylglucosamine 2-epimerase [Actinomycetota bacterium]
MIHIAIATKAEYIKTAPVLRELSARQIGYRILDIGQHGGLPRSFRAPLDIDEPDVRLGNGRDAETIPEVIRWAAGIARHLVRPRSSLRRDLFADDPDGICLVHGDTPSTLLATLLARRAGVPVAHLESGLRSFHLLQPFPEELSRIGVMRLAAVLYPPHDEAASNIATMKLKGEVVQTPGNTAIDAVLHAVGHEHRAATGPGIIAVHRVENLHRGSRVDGFLELLTKASAAGPARFHVHPPTERALKSQNRWDDVVAAGCEVKPLLPHDQFLEACATAPWVVTDGGSIQEECAVLGVPTLLWRGRTERPDGLDGCVVMSDYDQEVVAAFFADPAAYRRPPRPSGQESPAAVVAADLIARTQHGEGGEPPLD